MGRAEVCKERGVQEKELLQQPGDSFPRSRVAMKLKQGLTWSLGSPHKVKCGD